MGDRLRDPITGQLLSQAERHRMVVEAAVKAEELGYWCVAVGEHHFCDYIISSPPVLLAAIGERTERIRLSTAVTLGTNNDPIRLAEDYATLDVLTGGRVEPVLGRGNLYEHTFTAFGQDADLSREMFAERVALLKLVLENEQVDWSGQTRPPFRNFTTQPRPLQQPMPLWIGGGSSNDAADLAADLGAGLMLPGVFGRPQQFVPIVNHYRERWGAHGHDPAGCRVGTIAHTNVGTDGAATRATMKERMTAYMAWVKDLVAISSPRWGTDFVPEFNFDKLITVGPTVCGSVDEVTDRIGSFRDLLGLDVMTVMMDQGGMPPEELTDMMELFATDVMPEL